MSSIAVLDASAMLAHLQKEKGQEQVQAALDGGPCWATTVNLCEVVGKLCDHGMPSEEVQATVEDLGLTLVSFDTELAFQAAYLRTRTRPIGASLGDRACLALAEQTARTEPALIVYTAERSWTKLKWPFRIVVIR